MPKAKPKPKHNGEPVIGSDGSTVRALAFSGGVFDSAMQIGVAHALLVSRAAPPDLIVGVSTGAINAAALADILQAGGAEQDIKLQVARFREIMEEYQSGPSHLITSFIPDVYQTKLKSPLTHPRSPLHDAREHAHREHAIESKAGLLRLTNDLLSINLSLGAMIQLAQALQELRVVDKRQRWYFILTKRILAVVRLWRVLAQNCLAASHLAFLLVRPWVRPRQVFARMFRKKETDFLVRRNQKPRIEGPFSKYLQLIARRLGIFTFGWRRRGENAAELIYKSGTLGRIRHGAIVGAGLLGTITLLTLGTDVGAPLYWFAHLRIGNPWWLWVVAVVASLIACGLLIVPFVFTGETVNSILKYYRIEDGLLDFHPIRQWLIKVLDPEYYGRRSLGDMVEQSLTDHGQARMQWSKADIRPPTATPMQHFRDAKPSIHVVAVAANLQTGILESIPLKEPLIDSLLGSVAAPGLFNPERIGTKWYIDGAGLTNEAFRAAISYLRKTVHDDVASIEIYAVTPLPLSATNLRSETDYRSLVPVVRRAVFLERFRDATLQRGLTDLLGSAIPSEQPVWWKGRHDPLNPLPRPEKHDTVLLRVALKPIELSEVVDTTERVITGVNPLERRRAIAEAIADGCRSTLETIISGSIDAVANEYAAHPKDKPPAILCRAAVRHAAASQADETLPGSRADETNAPGLPEVCRHCCLSRKPVMGDGPAHQKQHVRVKPRTANWPHRTDGAKAPAPRQTASVAATAPSEPQTPGSFKTDGVTRDSRPRVSLLFSGGVFRGVYQVGVLNALSELNCRPDIVAGSSVGSITAAMAARMFGDHPEPEDRAKRIQRMRRVAATYLTIDSFVMTDRFMEFVGSLTVRAGLTDVSPRQIERVFRSFDVDSTEDFGNDLRAVLAAAERLLYLSPFEVKDLVHCIRGRRYAEVITRLQSVAQDWLERSAVGSEVLGAEPLALLIREHVLDRPPVQGMPQPTSDKSFYRAIDRSGIEFLATATNLNAGTLETFSTAKGDRPRILELLLATSAFPGVFKPRRKWEVSSLDKDDLLIDGGVMDNLPLDAVSDRLDDLSKATQNPISRRPRFRHKPVPHLLFTASLETEHHELGDDDMGPLARSWWMTRKRAKELGYNYKIDTYAAVQRYLRMIWEEMAAFGKATAKPPLNIEVLAVKPKWLVGTFSFHNYLGFDVDDQAASIAHGCRSTLAKMAEFSKDETQRGWLEAWRFDASSLTNWQGSARKHDAAQGHCWYRQGVVCPFSLPAGNATERSATRKELHGIYLKCRDPKTHAARDYMTQLVRGRRKSKPRKAATTEKKLPPAADSAIAAVVSPPGNIELRPEHGEKDLV